MARYSAVARLILNEDGSPRRCLGKKLWLSLWL